MLFFSLDLKFTLRYDLSKNSPLSTNRRTRKAYRHYELIIEKVYFIPLTLSKHCHRCMWFVNQKVSGLSHCVPLLWNYSHNFPKISKTSLNRLWLFDADIFPLISICRHHKRLREWWKTSCKQSLSSLNGASQASQVLVLMLVGEDLKCTWYLFLRSGGCQSRPLNSC